MLKHCLCICVVGLLTAGALDAQEFRPLRNEILPLPDHQVSFRIDGTEKLRWHYDAKYPRPFFYPLNGPAGVSLTRMGHPGAENHDHHRSVWFACSKVNDLDFWSDNETRIRQKLWYRYRDGDEESIMAVCLGWFDGNDHEVMEQDVVAAVRPAREGETLLEIQMTLRPAQGEPEVTINQTNFGLMAVRVSRSLSVHFGDGQLTSSEGLHDEQNVFGKRARWMDYSGPVVTGHGPDRQVVREGITFFDHPSNPRYPTYWHVREDGWMGASFAMKAEWKIDRQNPLVLRYLLHAHQADHEPDVAMRVQKEFAERSGFAIRRPSPGTKHLQFEAEREVQNDDTSLSSE